MLRLHLDDLPWEEWSSPGGAFHGRSKEISIALGARRDAHLAAGGHPFDLELGQLLPGRTGAPFHAHANQWELFLIVAGRGIVRHGADGATREVAAGDAILHPPFNPHQLANTGDTPLTYWLVADNPPADYWHYPDSGKWGFSHPRRFFRLADVAYWDDDPAAAPPPPFPSDAAARFVSGKDLPWMEKRSPRGTYASRCADLSLALGGIANAGVAHGGHPFDLQRRIVPPGAAICPYHAHAAQWEMFVIESGDGEVRTASGRTAVRAGDVILHPPDEPHQLRNVGAADLHVLIIADNPPADVFYYPDSDKWGLRKPGRFFRMTEVDYFDGEE
jgi:uncharacterized cupin superfamily protein